MFLIIEILNFLLFNVCNLFINIFLLRKRRLRRFNVRIFRHLYRLTNLKAGL